MLIEDFGIVLRDVMQKEKYTLMGRPWCQCTAGAVFSFLTVRKALYYHRDTAAVTATPFMHI